MANTTEFERPLAGERTGGRGIVLEVDRTRSHRVAKRHSTRVRTLKYALPLASIAILGVYGVSVLSRSDLGSVMPSIPIPDVIPENLTMDNPHYEGFGKDGSTYSIRARTAQQDFSNTSLIKLDGITGLLTEVDKKKTELTAAKGVFDHVANILQLENAIDIKSETGLKAKLSRALVNAKEGLVTSNDPVFVEFPGGSVEAASLTLRHKLKEVTFANAVKARLIPPQKPQSAAAAAKPAQTTFATSNAPVDVTSQRLDIKDAEKLAIFSGEVVAVQAESAITTPELTVHYSTVEPATALAAGAAKVAGKSEPQQANPMGAGKVSKILAKGPVVMTRGTTDRVSCDAADFNTEASSAVLAGNVVMTSGTDRRAVADRADLDSSADTALLTGEVVVSSGKNELKGRRLWIDRKAQRMQLTAPGGRIAARFVQGADKSKGTKKAAPAAGAGFATFKTDPNAPVDIDADVLDANDAAKVATFRGNVIAKQGGFTIRTAELQATYSGEAGMADVAGTQAPSAANKQGTELTRIEAKKKVVVTSGEGQTVNGDWAVFDTKKNTVTVGGDVILAQGKNVVRGTRLVIDMASGESTIETAPDTAAPKAGAEGWAANSPAGPAGTPSQGRPSAVFYPDQLKAMRDGGKQGGGKPSTGDAWQASTTPQSSGQGGH